MADGWVFKVTLESSYVDVGVAVNNVLYFTEVGDETGGVIPEQHLGDLVAASLSTAFSAGVAMRSAQTDNFHWDTVRVQRVWPGVPGGAYITALGVSGSAGSGGASRLPTICCVVARLHSTVNTRRGRGRLYLGGWAHGDGTQFFIADNGHWSVTVTNLVAAWLTDLRATRFPATGGAGPRYIWGVWSKATAGPLVPGVGYNNGFASMDSTSVDSVVRAQRRREIGVGI